MHLYLCLILLVQALTKLTPHQMLYAGKSEDGSHLIVSNLFYILQLYTAVRIQYFG